jgi:hypothetical protein
MSSVPDTVLNTSDDKIETARRQQQTELNAEVVELGKVSETRGGWIGVKSDIGAGFTTY